MSNLDRWAWLPIPVFFFALVLLWMADLSTPHESPYLLLGLNFLFSALVSLFVAWKVGRAFMERRTPGLLLLGCGAIIWGTASFFSVATSLAKPPWGILDPNIQVTTHNVSVWMSAFCHLTGTALSQQWRISRSTPRVWLASAYVLALCLTALIVLCTLTDTLPVFFVPGMGGTPLRQFVLGSTIIMFVVSALLLSLTNRPRLPPFSYWYGLALLLLAEGLLGAMIVSETGSFISWVSRVLQYLGGAYMVVAAYATTPEPNEEAITLQQALDNARQQPVAAVAISMMIVFFVTVLRLTFFQALGLKAPYLFFFSALMLAALYGGLWGGVSATLLSAFLASYFWIEPVGRILGTDKSTLATMVIFLGSGIMISWITDVMHRSRRRAAVAETEAAFFAERERNAQALRESEKRFRQLIRMAPLPICHVTSDGNFVFINERFTEKLGYTLDDIPTTDEWFRRAYPDEHYRLQVLEIWNMAVSRARQEGTIINPDEYRVTCKKGETRIFEISGISIGDDLLVTLFDLTERNRFNTELVAARQAADSANQAKSRFLANMSHEIRTPLNGIKGMSELLGYTVLTDQQKNYLDSIHVSTESLLALVNDLLDLSKVEAGKIELEKKDFSLRSSINDVIKAQASQLHSKGLTIRTVIPPDVPDHLTGDQLRLKQILLNLLGNAIKFTGKGEIVISAALLEQREKHALIKLSVADTGIGIKPEAMEKIFVPFQQADSSTTRKFGGTGLGLSICTKLVELMGGTISVESTEGVGSVFQVTIPFETHDIPLAEQAPTPSVPSKTWSGPSLRILLAEDNEISRNFIMDLLQRFGHSLIAAKNGVEAVEKWEKGTFDMILMDVQMPEMDGSEALRIIREREQASGQHTPAIALTAHTLREEQERLLNAGFDGHVSKPIDIAALNSEMQRCAGIVPGVIPIPNQR